MKINKRITIVPHLIGMFIFLYLMFLGRDVLFMIYIFYKDKIIYWKILGFKEAFSATLYIYIPVAFIKICIYMHLKEKEKSSTKNVKYSLKRGITFLNNKQAVKFIEYLQNF